MTGKIIDDIIYQLKGRNYENKNKNIFFAETNYGKIRVLDTKGTKPIIVNVPVTLVWGAKDFTHRKTDKNSIRAYIKECEVIEFENCGHFPELEDNKKMVQLINERAK